MDRLTLRNFMDIPQINEVMTYDDYESALVYKCERYWNDERLFEEQESAARRTLWNLLSVRLFHLQPGKACAEL